MFSEFEGDENIIEGEDAPKPELEDRYYSMNELMAMSDAELNELWESVPTERQAFYERAYDEAMSSLGQGDIPDEAAVSLTEQMINYYNSGQVPIVTGNRWVQVPGWIREAVEAGKDFDEATAKPGGAADDEEGLPMPVRIGAGVGIVALICLIAFLVFRSISGDDGVVIADDGEAIPPRRATQTADAVLELTALVAQTPTVTETPLALENIGSIVGAGDFEDYYPILLEVQPQGISSRVYVVQQKPIDVAEWSYDERNPDVASWISGLLIKPVLGIPYTPDNQSLMEKVAPGDELLLHMSTGNILTFVVESIDRVIQQDTTIFQQSEPGIAIVLLGETGANDRLVISGNYPIDQELLDQASGLPGAVSISQIGDEETLPGDVGTITVLDSYTSLGDDEGAQLPDDLAYLLVDVEITAPDDAPIDLRNVTFSLLDTIGQRYSTVTLNAVFTNYIPISGQLIQPGDTLTGTVAYLVPRTISSSATLNISTSQNLPPLVYILEYVRPVDLVAPSVEILVENVQLVSIEDGPDQLRVTYNVFNPSERVPAFLNQDDVFVVYADEVPPDETFPTGPKITPITSETDIIVVPTATPQATPTVTGDDADEEATAVATPFVPDTIEDGIPPGEAIDVVSAFNWDGSRFVGISIAGYQYFAQLQ